MERRQRFIDKDDFFLSGNVWVPNRKAYRSHTGSYVVGKSDCPYNETQRTNLPLSTKKNIDQMLGKNDYCWKSCDITNCQAKEMAESSL